MGGLVQQLTALHARCGKELAAFERAHKRTPLDGRLASNSAEESARTSFGFDVTRSSTSACAKRPTGSARRVARGRSGC
jgi:hypothetical protein